MFLFFRNFFFFFLALETSLFFWFFFDNEVNSHEYFLLEFFLIIFLNFYYNFKQNSLKFNIDIVFKFFLMLIKTPSYFFNYIFNVFKKIILFLLNFKYRHFILSNKIFFKKYFNNSFIMWRPLFKKTSYFGYYRSNRSKWIK